VAVPSRTGCGVAGSHRCLDDIPPADLRGAHASPRCHSDHAPAAGSAPGDQHVLAPSLKKTGKSMRVVVPKRTEAERAWYYSILTHWGDPLH